MNIESTQVSPIEISADAIVLGIYQDQDLSGAALELDQAHDGRISNLINQGVISSERYATTPLIGLEKASTPVVLVVGLGKSDEIEPALAYRAAGTAAMTLAKKELDTIAYYLDVEPIPAAIAGSIVGCVGQDLFRSEKKIHTFKRILWANAEDSLLQKGRHLGESMNLTRRTVNLPAGDIYPESFAEECEKMALETGMEIEIWDEKKLAKENCGAFLAVAQGSDKPPRLVIMKYKGTDESAAPMALVGKGVTFDSGGLSLKPSASMLDMKCDMTGAATVLGTMNAIAKLKLPVNVYGLVGLAENMVSGNSYKLGDVLRSRNGKTIEVHNTDAEGRLVLADTLDVAVDLGVQRIIDLATLTGACMVALGRDTSGVMTNDQEFCDQFLGACQRVGESAWQLPMFSFYGQQIQSKVADIKNVGDGRWGGAITAGKFLEEFVKDVPWVHIDIAGPSFQEQPKSWIDAGASGCMVAALVDYLESNQ
ncbi:MAG: leucyl aminopeptidase [Planctomycetota bacterium]